MRYFRKDPLSNRWVAYAQGREDRPNEFESNGRRRPGTRCPFCQGHERETPPQIASYGSQGPADDRNSWLVRVVPNKYPAFRADAEDLQISREGLYEGCGAAVGDHEVIIESPRHVSSLSELTDQEARCLMAAYRDRIQACRDTGRYRYALVFKNVGPQAGASLEHSHSQLVATPLVPGEIAQELNAAKQLFARHGACFFCRVIADEREHRARWVEETEHFIAICPYASRMPYEMWILPRKHEGHFAQQGEPQLAELAFLLRQLIQKLESLHGQLAYNYFIHTSPFDTSEPCHYHWHIEILPRLTTVAGFEWGTGYYINPVPPEQAAAILRT